RRKLSAKVDQSFSEFLVRAENSCRINGVGEQLPDELLVHRRANDEERPAGRGLFRRMRRVGDKEPGHRIFDEKIREEQRRGFHGGISAAPEKTLVAGEEVMFPKMMAQPR